MNVGLRLKHDPKNSKILWILQIKFLIVKTKNKCYTLFSICYKMKQTLVNLLAKGISKLPGDLTIPNFKVCLLILGNNYLLGPFLQPALVAQ